MGFVDGLEVAAPVTGPDIDAAVPPPCHQHGAPCTPVYITRVDKLQKLCAQVDSLFHFYVLPDDQLPWSAHTMAASCMLPDQPSTKHRSGCPQGDVQVKAEEGVPTCGAIS